MSRKNILKQFKIVDAGDMSQASITSAVTCIQFLDNVGIQLNFSGAPVGDFEIQVSADYEQNPNGSVINAGNWAPLALSYLSGGSFVDSFDIPTSVGSPIYLDLNQLSAPFIRIVYTKTSGSGSLDAFITAKMV